MNNPRSFFKSKYTRDLEEALEDVQTALEHTENELMHERTRSEGMAYLRDQEIDRLYLEIKDLRAQNLGLIDRVLIKNQAIPLSEPLTRPTPTAEELQAQGTHRDTVRRTGPVSKARQLAESEYEQKRDREAVLASRPKVDPVTSGEEITEIV
jgi:hypothetical protein